MKEKLQKKTDVFVVLFAVVVIVLSLSPFWLFGSYSSMGWFDERDGFIPWSWAMMQMGEAEGFLHGYVGGTGEGGWSDSNARVFLYDFLIEHTELWVANLVMRFVGSVLTLLGLYVLFRKIFTLPTYLALALSLFGLLTNFTAYGWYVGGGGWNFVVLVWFLVAAFIPNRSEYKAQSLGVAVAIVGATTCKPYFVTAYLPFAWLLLFFLRVSSSDRKRFVARGIGLVTSYTVFMIWNWYDGIRRSVIEASQYSARILSTLSETNANLDVLTLTEKLFRLGYDQVYDLYSFLNRDPSQQFVVAYFVILVLGYRAGRLKSTLAFVCVWIVGPAMMHIVFFLSGLPLLSSYRWNHIWAMHSVVLSIYLAYQLKAFSQLAKYRVGVSAILILCSLIGAFQLARVTFLDFGYLPAMGSVKHYQSLNALSTSEHSFRVLSAGKVGHTPLFYGIDTFDGMLQNFPWRRNLFVAYAVSDPPKKSLHTHRHHFFEFPAGVDFSMLKLANVRYVLSDHPIEDSHLNLLAQEESFPVSEHSVLPHWVRSYFGELTLVSPLYVYEWKGVWPRVFSASRLTLSSLRVEDRLFYEKLKNLSVGELVVSISERAASAVIGSDFQTQILRRQFGREGLRLELDGRPGVIAFNQVYTPHWSAQCDGQTQPVVPANGILMAVRVPTGCTSLFFRYRSFLPPKWVSVSS